MVTKEQVQEAYNVIAQYVSEDTENRAAILATNMGESSLVSVVGFGNNLAIALGAAMDGDKEFTHLVATTLLINSLNDDNEEEETFPTPRPQSKFVN